MNEFESACCKGNIDLAKDLLLHNPIAGQSGASFLSRLISLLEDMPIGVGVVSENIDSSSTDEEILEYEKEKASRSREEVIKRRIRESSQNKNIRGCLRRAIVKTLKIAIKAVCLAKSASIFELLVLLIRVLESPRLHYDINYDIARALIKYGGLSSKDISSLVVILSDKEANNLYTYKQANDQYTTITANKDSTILSISKESTIPSISKTPLHAAVTSGCFELCWLLVERFGAIQSLRVKDTPGGRTPSQLAALFEFTEISDWLLEQESGLID